MNTIWKYPLYPNTSIEMPAGAQILSVHEQGGEIAIWAKVDTTQPMERRHFEIYGTGHVIPAGLAEELTYLGTAHLHRGSLVLHAFEAPATVAP